MITLQYRPGNLTKRYVGFFAFYSLFCENSGILATIFVVKSNAAQVAVAVHSPAICTMARYTNFFMTGAPKEDIHRGLLGALEACDLDLIYQDPAYIVAKEKPGRVSFTQITTVELLINPPTLELGGAKIDVVVKNEELPLRKNNHCREIFDVVNQAIANSSVETFVRN